MLIFAGLPLVSRADEHVTMDFIDRMLPPAGQRVLVRFVHAVCAAIMFFLAWQVWIKAGKISAYGDTTDVLRITVGPFVYFMDAMIALTGLVHVYKIVRARRRRRQPGHHLARHDRSADRPLADDGARVRAHADRVRDAGHRRGGFAYMRGWHAAFDRADHVRRRASTTSCRWCRCSS